VRLDSIRLRMMNNDVEAWRRELQRLRNENAQRWERIEELHERQREDPSQLPSVLEMLQTEIDLLPHKNGVYAQCDTLLDQIESSSSFDGVTSESVEDSFAQEVVNSFHQLWETNVVMSESIQRENHKIQAIDLSVVEHADIQKVLLQEQKRQEVSDNLHEASLVTQSSFVNDSSSTTTIRQDDEECRRKNEQLKDDLAYTVKCIEQTRASAQKSQIQDLSTPNNRLRLDELILLLVDRLLTCPDDPYLSLEDDSRIQPDHVDLLKKCWIVQSFKDDESLIRLFNYHC
jgi:hypothetical protein